MRNLKKKIHLTVYKKSENRENFQSNVTDGM